MDARVLLFLLVLGTSRSCNARVVTTNFSPVQNGIASAFQQINHQQQEKEVEAVGEFDKIEQLCTLCTSIATPVLSFLSDGSNQQKVTSVLNKMCSFTFQLKDQCTTAVNYYLPLFFLQVSVLTPKLLCAQIGLCDLIVSTSQHLSENSCKSCNDLVTEVLLKLKGPNTKLEIIGVLLKACDAVDDFGGSAEKCKTIVSTYAPLILDNAKQFLERYDVCTTLHACSSATNATMQTSMRSAS